MKKIVLYLVGISALSLVACGRDDAPSGSSSPTVEQRRAEALRVRENSKRGTALRQPVTVRRSGDQRVDAYRVMMETRRRAMHGVGPRTSDGEPSIRKARPAD